MANFLYDSDTKACMLYVGSYVKRWKGTKPTSRWLVTIKAKIQQNIIRHQRSSCAGLTSFLCKNLEKRTLRRKCYGHKFHPQATKGKRDGD